MTSSALRFYVSGYNSDASEPGIYAYNLDPDTGRVTPAGTSTGVASPSYCTLKGDRLYAASETPDAGGLAAYTLNDAEVPEVDASVSFPHAAGTCFALLHPKKRCLYGADYNSGSISISQLDEHGNVTNPVAIVQHEGQGSERFKDDPNYDRQLAPHVHTLSFVPGTSLLAAVDLGLDMIVLYKIDADGKIVDSDKPTVINEWPDQRATRTVLSEMENSQSEVTTANKTESGIAELRGTQVKIERQMANGKGGNSATLPIKPASIVEAPLFNGPRIIAYHPTEPLAAVICELGCEMLLYKIEPDGMHWTMTARINLLEGAPTINDIQPAPLSAHVQFSNDGRFIYTSTRGTDQMIVFSLDDELVARRVFSCSCDGGTPRHFALSPDGSFLAVANQTSSTVTLFKCDKATGALKELDKFECPTPSCIVWKE